MSEHAVQDEASGATVGLAGAKPGEPPGGSELTAALAQEAHQRVDEAAELAARAERQVRNLGGEVGPEANERMRRLLDESRTMIRDNPLAAIAAALAIGFVVDSVVRR